MADTTNTTFRFRNACEECHARKTRCYPSSDQHSECCEACRVNQRRCLFSLKSKLGRPRKMNRSHSTPTGIQQTSALEMRTFNEEPIVATFNTSATENMTNFPSPRAVGNFADNSNVEEFMVPRSPHSHRSSFGLSPPAARNQSYPDMIEYTSSGRRQIQPTISTNRSEDAHSHSSRGKKSQQLEGSCNRARPSDPIGVPEASDGDVTSTLSPFSNELLDFSMDDFTQTAMDQFGQAVFPSSTLPPTQLSQFVQNTSQFGPHDHQDIIQIYSELHAESQKIMNGQINLFAEKDRKDLQRMMSIMRRIGGKISALFETSYADRRAIGSQGIGMVIFACVIQAVDCLNNLVDNDVAQEKGSLNRYHEHSQSLPNLSDDSTPSNNIRDDGVSDTHLDLIMIVTKLDFVLMQFKGFVRNFNSLVLVMSLTHPSELLTNLNYLHQKFVQQLEGLKVGWD